MKNDLEKIISDLKKNLVKFLDLSEVTINKEAVAILAETLKNTTGLKVINLSNNAIDWCSAIDLIRVALKTNRQILKIIINSNPYHLCGIVYDSDFFATVRDLEQLIKNSNLHQIEFSQSYFVAHNPFWPCVISFEKHPAWKEGWESIRSMLEANKKKNLVAVFVRGSMIGFFKKLNLPPQLEKHTSKFLDANDARNIALTCKLCSDLADRELNNTP